VPGSAAAWDALRASIAGELCLPGSPAFDRSTTFNARFHDVRPGAVVLCSIPEDVSETISFALGSGLEIATRSGGHSLAGHSSSTGIVIDTTPMRSVTVSGDVAMIGGGGRLGYVYDSLQDHGLTIPSGSCPWVGVAGHTLGGGLGILGRMHSVTSDHLVGAQVVLADGRIVDCDERIHQDLFWALRGAGWGSFGVVTTLVLETVREPAVTNFHLSWGYSDATRVIEAWQSWAPHAPDELAVSLKLTWAAGNDVLPSCDIYGALQGTQSDATELLDEVGARVGVNPASFFNQAMSYANTRRFWALLGSAEAGIEPSAPLLPPSPPYLWSKSEFFGRPLPSDAIEALLRNFSSERDPGESRELDFMPWGGAYNRHRPDDTAFVHRSESFLLKHAIVIDLSASPEAKRAAQQWVTRSWALVHPWASGRAFQNFADPNLEGWARAYYGQNLERLVGIKTRYDPGNVFRSGQSIPVE
jgi:FAD/FMN-containing dehydrogenase